MTTNAITVNAGLRSDNGNFKFNMSFNFQVDQTDNKSGGNPGKVTIGTTEEVVALGDITTPGWLIMRNLDATNYVQWGPEYSGTSGIMEVMGRLEPKEIALFRVDPGTIIRMKADTAACDVYIAVLDD